MFPERDRHSYWKIKPKQASPAFLPCSMDLADNFAAGNSLRSGNGPTPVGALCGYSPPFCWLTTPICMEKGVKHPIRPYDAPLTPGHKFYLFSIRKP